MGLTASLPISGSTATSLLYGFAGCFSSSYRVAMGVSRPNTLNMAVNGSSCACVDLHATAYKTTGYRQGYAKRLQHPTILGPRQPHVLNLDCRAEIFLEPTKEEVGLQEKHLH